MFLCLISLPRILRENVSTNIKATAWTTAAVPNHLPSPSLTWWVPLPSAQIYLVCSQDFHSDPHTHYQGGKEPIKFEGWQKIRLIIFSPQFARLSLSIRLSTLSLNGHNQDESGLIGHLSLTHCTQHSTHTKHNLQGPSRYIMPFSHSKMGFLTPAINIFT